MSRPNYEDSVAGETTVSICIGCPICNPLLDDDDRGTCL